MKKAMAGKRKMESSSAPPPPGSLASSAATPPGVVSPPPSLKDLLAKARKTGSLVKELRPTATVVRGRNGKIKVEREELLSSEQKQDRINVSTQAGKDREKQEGIVRNACGWKKVFSPSLSSPAERNDAAATNHNKNRVTELPFYEFPPNGTIDQTKPKQAPVTAKTLSTTTTAATATTETARTTLRILTYNIWFSPYEWEKRLGGLVNLIVHQHDVDVVCLQEVTPHALARLMCISTIRQNYYVSDCADTDFTTLGSLRYGVAMLIRKRRPGTNGYAKNSADENVRLEVVPTSLELLSLPTRMGRKAMVASFVVRSAKTTAVATATTTEDITTSASTERKTQLPHYTLAIATVHLESLRSKEWRRQQLEAINQHLTASTVTTTTTATTDTSASSSSLSSLPRYDAAVLVGDFNVTATGPWGNQDEHDSVCGAAGATNSEKSGLLGPGFEDLWVREHGNSGDVDDGSDNHYAAVTFDTVRNSLLSMQQGRPDSEPIDHSRYDRVVVKDGLQKRVLMPTTGFEAENNPSMHQTVFSSRAHSIQIVGNNPIANDSNNLFISDHFGLLFKWDFVLGTEMRTM